MSQKIFSAEGLKLLGSELYKLFLIVATTAIRYVAEYFLACFLPVLVASIAVRDAWHYQLNVAAVALIIYMAVFILRYFMREASLRRQQAALKSIQAIQGQGPGNLSDISKAFGDKPAEAPASQASPYL